jgi:hypothetical protein
LHSQRKSCLFDLETRAGDYLEDGSVNSLKKEIDQIERELGSLRKFKFKKN